MPLLGQVLEQYPNEVKLVFKNFPLRNHQFARPAAIAAMAAGDQGKFWEFHDELFKNYNKLNDQKIEEIATNLGLDRNKFDAARKNGSNVSIINRDVAEGSKIGVRGTPSIFINGVILKNRSLQGFRYMIEKAMNKKNDT